MSEDSVEIGIGGSGLGSQLRAILMGDDIQPGSDVSYQLAKIIYLYHPLGQKMAEAPIALAQSQERKVTVQGAPDLVVKVFRDEWRRRGADVQIANVHRLARIYGIAAIVLGCEQVKENQPLDLTKIWQQELYFNVLDPLNTAGSLVLNQIPTASDFQKPVVVSTGGVSFHRSRFRVVMNEQPVYLAYTNSAFGFVGRSVYQRALFPLKSFIRTMIADDMIATKLGLLVAKQKGPGSVVDQIMEFVAGVKRRLLKDAQTGQVLTVDVDEDITTLNMQNVDGAGTYSRNNILKNVATAAEMPALLIENETMVEGFGEGTEDAKQIVHFVERFRRSMEPQYKWFDNIIQYLAWTPEFYKLIQREHQEEYGAKSFEEAFFEWQQAFAAEWPSLMIEPESEKVEVEKAKADAILGAVQLILEKADPANQAIALQWMADNLGENKMLFPHDLQLDMDTLEEHLEDTQDRLEEQEEANAEGLAKGMAAGPPGKGFGAAGAKAGAKQGIQAGANKAAKTISKATKGNGAAGHK